MFISVDLPEPDEPMIATNSPGSTRETDAAQRFDLDIADDESAGEVLDLDDRVSVRPVARASDDASEARRRQPLAARLHAAFGDDDLIASAEIALDDLGEVVVVETGRRGPQPADRRARPRLALSARRRAVPGLQPLKGRRAHSAAPGPGRAAHRLADRRRSGWTRSCRASAPDRCYRRRPRHHR